jgi:hypothetical protein
VLVDADPPVFDPPVPPPPIPLEVVDDPLLGSQLAVWSEFFTHSNPALQPQSVQSPGWHWLSFPHVSLGSHWLGPRHMPGEPVDPQSVSQTLVLCLSSKIGQPAITVASKPTKPSRESLFILSPESAKPPGGQPGACSK